MTKKTQKLKPDTVLKNYWNDNEQFADLFNAVLFEGRQMIKPDELEDVDTEESSVFEHREYVESISASRDNIKVRKRSSVYGVELVLLGMESQEYIHYAMPMRLMGYDYGSYKKQYDSNAKKYKTAKGLSEDEYLSRMKKDDKFIPVITVVIYYGENPWDGPKTLHDMLDIPKEIEKYVNDYKMLLVEARQNNLILHNMNNRDLFNLLEIVLDKERPLKETRDKAIEYTRENEVDKNVVMTVAGAANCRLDYRALVRKGDGDMCTVFEETWMEGKAEGLAEGKAEGRAEGKIVGIIKMLRKYKESDEKIISELVSELEVSESVAKEYLEQYNKGAFGICE